MTATKSKKRRWSCLMVEGSWSWLSHWHQWREESPCRIWEVKPTSISNELMVVDEVSTKRHKYGALRNTTPLVHLFHFLCPSKSTKVPHKMMLHGWSLVDSREGNFIYNGGHFMIDNTHYEIVEVRQWDHCVLARKKIWKWWRRIINQEEKPMAGESAGWRPNKHLLAGSSSTSKIF